MALGGSGWWLEHERHSLARQGVSTVPPEQVKIKQQSTKRFSEIKKLPNRIQNQIQETSRILKRLSYAQPEEASKYAVEAKVKYVKLKELMVEYLGQDTLPPWTEKDWVGKENWYNNGQICNLIQDLETENKSNEIAARQEKLRLILETKK